jgi:hypothetical protein
MALKVLVSAAMGKRPNVWVVRGLFVTFTTVTLYAGELELQPSTLKSWIDYEQAAVEAMQQRLHGGGCFLTVVRHPDRISQVRGGEIVVWPAQTASPRRVPSGLIHDWIGAAFIQNARIADVITVVRDYRRYKDVYKPGVLDAHLLRQTGSEDQFSMLLRNPSFFTKTALEGEFTSEYIRLDETRWYSVTRTDRLQEIDDYGQPGEHKLPPDRGHGYIWRLTTLSQMEERDGGVYVEQEVLALSRDVPAGLRWMAGPIIRREARQSTASAMERTRTAVASTVADFALTKRQTVPQTVTSSLLSR